MITETFGPMLYIPQSQCLLEFPSPESLKYRIVISTKPPKEYLEVEAKKANDDEQDLETEEKVYLSLTLLQFIPIMSSHQKLVCISSKVSLCCVYEHTTERW